METFNLDKLICAIELILYKSLKENSDDSYTHKLIDLVDFVKPELSLDDLYKLNNIVGNALSHETAVNDIELSTAFKLVGTIVSDERFINQRPEVVTSSFNWIIKFSHLLQNEEEPHYDLQYSFLKCINKLCSTESGCLLLAKNEDLLLVIFHLLTKSQGFYVQMEAQSVITILLENVLDKPNVSHKLSPYLHQMLLVNCKSHMECLNNLVKKDCMRRFLISQFNLDTILLSKLKSSIKNDKLLSLFCEILACCRPSEEVITQVVQTLMADKKLKAIISFYTALLKNHDKTHFNEWKLFTIYPFAQSNTELSEQIIGDSITRKLIAEYGKNDFIMLALSCIDEKVVSLLSSDEHLFILLCIGNFLKDAQHSIIPKKTVFKSLITFNLLWKLSDCPTIILKSLEIILALMMDSFNESISLQQCQFEIMKNVREIIQQHRNILPQQILIDVCSKVNDILVLTTSDADLDLVDSVLEIMIAVLNSNGESFVKYYPELIDNFLSHWSICYQTSNDTSLISSCIPILLCVDLYCCESQLNKVGISKNQTIPAILTNYLIEGEYLLRDSVIKAIDYNYPSFIASNSWNRELSKLFTKFYGLPMSQLILSEIDSEVLSNILLIWISICNTIKFKQDAETRFNLIQMLYESGFLTSLWLLLKDELVLGTIKVLALNGAKEVFNLLQSTGITSAELTTILSSAVEPEFSITVEDIEYKTENGHNSREQVIDEIFMDRSTLPTQDLIEIVTEEFSGTKKLIKKKREIGDVSIALIANFFTTPLTTIVDMDVAPDPIFAILDDIIAARNFDTRIPSDCY
ncbi:uncharacterized protein LOC107366562 [Tetranychus urticae]|uniref:Uncharacterized protein n=1 Tax=Tetranychus urticae TaxID=32264 RepID=T1KQW2_TETUR|nr:uncharacterized protein LOC107366562 [Tetranychus urticae]